MCEKRRCQNCGKKTLHVNRTIGLKVEIPDSIISKKGIHQHIDYSNEKEGRSKPGNLYLVCTQCVLGKRK